MGELPGACLDKLLDAMSDVANGAMGPTIYVGAPIGTAAALTALLTGRPAPAFNECGAQ